MKLPVKNTFFYYFNYFTILNKFSFVCSYFNREDKASGDIPDILRNFPVPFSLNFEFPFYIYPFNLFKVISASDIESMSELPVLREEILKITSGYYKASISFLKDCKVDLKTQIIYHLGSKKAKQNDPLEKIEIDKNFILNIPKEIEEQIFMSLKSLLKSQKLRNLATPQKTIKKGFNNILSILKQAKDYQLENCTLEELQNFLTLIVKITDFFIEKGVYQAMKEIKKRMDSFCMPHQEKFQELLQETSDGYFERLLICR